MNNQEILNKWIEEQNNFYPVIVDGNRHEELPIIKTKKEQITIKKCKELIKNIQNAFPEVKIDKIQIMMSEWSYNELSPEDIDYVNSMDISPKQTVNKNAYYIVNENCLRIFENDMPVYENNNGIICRDKETLADCLM